MRILVVDDHALFREGLIALLEEQKEVEIVGQAADGFSAVEKTRELMPDVVLMDLSLPRCNGVEATRLIMREMPYANITILTASEKDEDLFEAMKAGAKGYLVKSVTTKDLVSAISFIAQGHVIIGQSMAGKLLGEFGKIAERATAPDSMLAGLTEREREILLKVGEGLTNREIAERLFVSEATVKTHLRNILEKLHLHNRIEAAVYASQQGLRGRVRPQDDLPK